MKRINPPLKQQFIDFNPKQPVTHQLRNFKFIRKIAWSFFHTTGIDFDDLLSEAVIAYMEGLQYYSPKSNSKYAKITTYAYKRMIHRLCDYSKQWKKYSGISTENTRDNSYTPEYEFFPPVYPKDVKVIIDIIMSAPEEFADLMPKMARGRVFHQLREMGYSHGKCWEMIKNMKKFINESEEFSIII